MSPYQRTTLTEPQKRVVLAAKLNGGKLPKLEAMNFDPRVVNNLLRRDILREDGNNVVLVENGVTEKEKQEAAKRGKPRPCYCGCGCTTRGGRFITGHDGRLHFKVKHYVKTGECLFDPNYEEMKEYLKSVHWMTPEMWEVVSRA